MTPVEELSAAAERLDALSGAITPCLSYVEDGHVLPEDSAWFELMNCPVGKALAKALHADAKKIIDSTVVQPFYKGNADLLAIARLINGTTS